MSLTLFATAPRGVADLLAAELARLDAHDISERRGGVAFTGSLGTAYRACLWSRVASRVLLLVGQGPAQDADALYETVRGIDWSQHLAPTATLAVDFLGRNAALAHSQFGARRVKDAIVDQCRARTGVRPDVDLERPDLRINVHLEGDTARIALDLSGDSLHRRGYRPAGSVAAPLRENLAACVLLRAGWPAIAAAGGALVDLMCGAGTLPIEGALMAADIAPGLLRREHGFERWPGHDAALWASLLAEADERRAAGLRRLPPVIGYDDDGGAIAAAAACVTAAGLAGQVHVERRALGDPRSAAAPDGVPGLVVANPPYGERLGDVDALAATYRALGDAMRTGFAGWSGAVLTGTPALGRHLGLRARRSHTLWNGAIECRLLRFTLDESSLPESACHPVERARTRILATGAPTPGAAMFANRLRKNLRELGRWATREHIDCWRVYDADMPEYALAIDLYHDCTGTRHVHVQEYGAPASVARESASRRLAEALAVLPDVLEVPSERIALKRRQRQRGSAQYERTETRRGEIEVREGRALLHVNLFDYLDTGLFLDHRPTRLLLGQLADRRSFLNLFCYTAAATVHAALGGATRSTSFDLSQTYLDWARRNFAANGIDTARHTLVRADCRAWLTEHPGHDVHYDLVFLDPPTFSNSKRMDDVLDIQRDHVALIRGAMRALAPGGLLVFSTNLRSFRLDGASLADLVLEDRSAASVPRDFARNPRIHRCWWIRAAAGARAAPAFGPPPAGR